MSPRSAFGRLDTRRLAMNSRTSGTPGEYMVHHGDVWSSIDRKRDERFEDAAKLLQPTLWAQ